MTQPLSQPPPTLLTLPAELRAQIYTYCIPTSTALALFQRSLKQHRPTYYAEQPVLSQCNKPLREEVLSVFYGTNTFLLDFTNAFFTSKSFAWIRSLGDVNVGLLRRVVFCSHVMVAFGHMSSRRTVKFEVELKTDEVGKRAGCDAFEGLEGMVEEFRGRVRRRWQAGKGAWNVESLAALAGDFQQVIKTGY